MNHWTQLSIEYYNIMTKRLNDNSTGFFVTTSSYEQIDLYEKLKIKMAV